MSPEPEGGRMALVMIFAALFFRAAPSALCAGKIVTLDYRIFPGLADMDGNLGGSQGRA